MDKGVTQHLLIIGAGPAAVGAALAATERDDVRVTVIDVGGQLEEAHSASRSRMSLAAPDAWDTDDRRRIAQLPVDTGVKGLPEKRAYGSDFAFRNFGQRFGVVAAEGLNDAVVSGAYGGFSNVWGAQALPFTPATFDAWPISAEAMYESYERVLTAVPYAAEHDDLSELFPLVGHPSPLPQVSDRTSATLARYSARRAALAHHGILMGRARLAMDANACVRCGLCMTGCPYSLIYSASHTLDALRGQGAIEYRSGLLAHHVAETATGVVVAVKDIQTGRTSQVQGDRVALACGALGTTRLVLGSLGLFDQHSTVLESAQFMVPFFSRRAVADPTPLHDFTLNQFNMAMQFDGSSADLAFLHFYTYNPSFTEALPGVLKRTRTATARRELLRRLSVALGYVPSWASPTFSVTARATGRGDLPEMKIDGRAPSAFSVPMLRTVMVRLLAAAPHLDLWPIIPMVRLSAGAKSYHWGGTFPHTVNHAGDGSSDTLGRVGPWRRVHLVDASVFPTVPATTFTATIMANAHRITRAALREES
jgi:ferredoxin